VVVEASAASPVPAIIFWGADRTFVCNEAYRAAFAGDAPGPDLCPPPIAALRDRVLGSSIGPPPETAMLALVRDGVTREAHFDLRGTPVTESGRVVAAIVTTYEVTLRILSERRLRSLHEMASEAHAVRSLEEAVATGLAAMGSNRHDVVYALAYGYDAANGEVRLLGSAGVETAEADVAPGPIETAPWPFASAIESGIAVEAPRDWLAAHFASGEEWPNDAFLAPIRVPGRFAPFGFLVVGLSPRLAYGQDYRGYLELAAGQLAISLSHATTEPELEREERLRAEAEAARANAIQLIDSLPALLSVSTGPEHTYQLVNRAYSEAMGVEHGAVVGLPFREAHPQAELTSLVDLRDRAFAGSTVSLRELPLRRTNSTGYFHITYLPTYSPSGNVTGVLSFAIDVTEQVTARRQVEALAEQLATANTFKDEILALVSHELRTPLTIVLGHLEMMRGAEKEGSEAATVADDALQSAQRLRRLVENMLALARSEVLGAEDGEPMLLHRAIPEIVESLRLDVPGATRVETVVDPVPPVLAHAVFLEQILENLVTNALKYGDPHDAVRINVAAEGANVVIRVESGGRKFEERELDAIFDPFYRASDSSARAGGLGLGLAVCRRLAESQGAEISARPRDGGGLLIELRFPVLAEA
jgi:signal transduction histidine kinase